MKNVKNMRRGFTMIELIFVIVIIGILAAIALPKLMATRDDALVTTIVGNTRTIAEDVKDYYTSQGEDLYLAAYVVDITDVPLYTNNTCGTQALGTTVFAGTDLFICDDQPVAVLKVSSTNTANAENNITLEQEATTGSTVAIDLAANSTFQALTNGTTGKTSGAGGVKVVR